MTISGRLFVGFIAVCVLLAAAAGLSIMDNPQLARFKRLDDKRVRELQSLSNAINIFRGKTHKLPESLDQLAQDQGLQQLKFHDDEGQPYEYRVKDDAGYELCARFDAASDGGAGTVYGLPGGAKHPAGRHCFNFTTGK